VCFFDSQLTFSEHNHQKINKAYGMLGIIKRNFIHMVLRTFILLYKALVRPHVEYANSVWSPSKIGDMEAVEFYLYPTVGIVLIHSIKPELTE